MNSRVSVFLAACCGVLPSDAFCSWTPFAFDAGKQFALSLPEKKGEGKKTKTLGEYKALCAKVMFSVQESSHE
jgi:hypothetical protein